MEPQAAPSCPTLVGPSCCSSPLTWGGYTCGLAWASLGARAPACPARPARLPFRPSVPSADQPLWSPSCLRPFVLVCLPDSSPHRPPQTRLPPVLGRSSPSRLSPLGHTRLVFLLICLLSVFLQHGRALSCVPLPYILPAGLCLAHGRRVAGSGLSPLTTSLVLRVSVSLLAAASAHLRV